jgi:predicted nucleic acid-binding protein
VKVATALKNVSRLAFDSAPIIYYVEGRPGYTDRMRTIVRLMTKGQITAFSSVITLTEVLVKPLAQGNIKLVNNYRNMLLSGRAFHLISITPNIAEHGADLRARYNLKTPDALQIAVALDQHCDAFLTNDLGLKRVTEVQVLVLDELSL